MLLTHLLALTGLFTLFKTSRSQNHTDCKILRLPELIVTNSSPVDCCNSSLIHESISITCNYLGRVTSVIFRKRVPLHQGITEKIGELTFLKVLAVNDTKYFPFSSGIPKDSLSKLVNLEVLDLSSNFCEGNISSYVNFENLKNLKHLDLSKNRFDDNLNFLNNLEHLTFLDLSENNFYVNDFNGAFSKLRKLEVLKISNGLKKVFSQPLPNPLELSKSLRILDMWFCFDSPSTIPPNLETYTNLKSLALNGNNLFGSLDVLSKLTNLTTLQIGSNNFEGIIPSFIPHLSLSSLDLSNNKFTKLPENFENLRSLEILNLAGNLIDDDIKFLNNFYNLKVLRLSNNSFFGKVPNISQNKELGICAVLNSGENICYDSSVFIPTTCIRLLSFKFGNSKKKKQEDFNDITVEDLQATKPSISFSRMRSFARIKKVKIFSPKYDYDNKKIPVVKFVFKIILSLLFLGYLSFSLHRFFDPSGFIEDVSYDSYDSKSAYLYQDNSFLHLGSNNIPIATFNIQYRYPHNHSTPPKCQYQKAGVTFRCNDNPDWYLQTNNFIAATFNISRSDLFLRDLHNFDPSNFLLGSVFERLYVPDENGNVDVSVESIQLTLDLENNIFIGGTVDLTHLFNLGFRSKNEIRAAVLHKNLRTATIVPNYTNIIKFKLSVFKTLDPYSGFFGTWDALYDELYSYEIHSELHESKSDTTSVILLPLGENSLIISKERRNSLFTIVATCLTFFTSLITFHWFLFGRGPFRPWGYVQQKFGLIKRIARKRKARKGKNSIDWDLSLFLKMSNLMDKNSIFHEALQKQVSNDKSFNYMKPEEFAVEIVETRELEQLPNEILMSEANPSGENVVEDRRANALKGYRKKLMEHREIDSKLRDLRLGLRQLDKDFDKSEEDIKALQSVGQMIGEVLKERDAERYIVKASSGPRYVVGCRSKVPKNKLTQGTRVALDMTTLTIMRILPREVDPLVYNMSTEDPGNVTFAGIGGLGDQIRELREVIELPLLNPELFIRVGIKPPKGVLLYGPPGTGKTLLARAVASTLECNFLKVVSSAIVDKYIGESARLIREMFGYAKEHEPCIIFMDEIDAIGGRRFSEGTSADREIQRTLMELLNQMDGFDYLGQTKLIMATNRPDTLDPALLRPGRLDRKIEIPLPNEQGRLEILKIHASGVTKHGEIDYEAVVKLSDTFNGADLRNVCTEAGMFAIREEREYVIQDDFMKAVRKVADAKKLEGKLDYKAM
ncbi:26S proteasome subunit rpt4 [Clydaea vesicula]|uniref:26S proteasome subunit rpt4 n=1 Tax=Clydaea vesicula TaxID=447962 RepID=A0AAD5TXL0_9FUNG|nr:26S proteasome subunit rpt4 [Clydaea vesicula]